MPSVPVQKHFQFLRLPFEVRYIIYELALFQLKKRHRRCGNWHSAEGHPDRGKKNTRWTQGNVLVDLTNRSIYRQSIPSLLRASGEIHSEAAPVYYSINKFTFAVTDMWLYQYHNFLEALGNHSKLLRRVEFHFRGEGGSMEFDEHVQKNEKFLDLSLCRIRATGRHDMIEYYHMGINLVEELRSLGLGWLDVAEAIRLTVDLVEYTHRDGSEPWADDYYSSKNNSSDDEWYWKSGSEVADEGQSDATVYEESTSVQEDLIIGS